ncbi:hypothetical protein RSOL_299270, partial [Rhizoctonia solani AG-3 Rhs1AP]
MHNIQRQLLKNVDRRLPTIKAMTLRQWNDIYRDLSGDALARNTFALTGHYTCPEDGQRYRAKIDTSSCSITRHQELSQICDIDSVIGIIRGEFPLKPRRTLRYYMLASPTHTLTSNLHIPELTIHDENGDEEEVALHRLPNARFAEMGEKELIRIVFPNARKEFKHQSEPNCVPDRHMGLFYDKAVLPAAILTLPMEIRRTWPASYQDEKWRAGRGCLGNNNGNQAAPARNHVQHSGREVHSEYLSDWLAAIRAKVDAEEDLAWARGFFFVMELRGVKNHNVSIHPPPEGPLLDEGKSHHPLLTTSLTNLAIDGYMIDPYNPRTVAVENVLSDFNTEEFAEGCWFLDIAITASALRREDGSGICLLPSAQTHPEIISHLTGVDLQQAEKWVRSKGSCYRRDEVAHLGDIAGFAIDLPGPGINGIHFIQVYTTEKSVGYRVDGPSHAKRISPYMIVSNWKGSKADHFVPLEEAFCNSSATHSVAVRIELRISFEQYPNHQYLLPQEIVQPWFLWLSNSTFWGWKVYRLDSILSTLNRWMITRDQYTLDDLPEAGSLLVLLSWMANALVNRPDDGNHWDEVRDAGSVHMVRANKAVPYRPLTAYFLHSLSFPENAQPRVSSLRTISSATILYLFSDSATTRDELEVFALITQPVLPAPEPKPLNPWRVGDVQEAPVVTVRSHSNKQREVRIENAQEVADQFAEIIHEPERMVQYDSEDEDYEEREVSTRRSVHLTRIVHNYPIQALAKAPNQQGGITSWCALDDNARLKINFEFFSNLQNLHEAFPRHILFGSQGPKWDKTVAAFFPTPAEMAKHYQGYHTLKVRKQWGRLLATFPKDRRDEIVSVTREYVSSRWRWLPLLAKDHLWSTGVNNVPKYATQHGAPPGGPWIIFNPRRIDPRGQ